MTAHQGECREHLPRDPWMWSQAVLGARCHSAAWIKSPSYLIKKKTENSRSKITPTLVRLKRRCKPPPPNIFYCKFGTKNNCMYAQLGDNCIHAVILSPYIFFVFCSWRREVSPGAGMAVLQPTGPGPRPVSGGPGPGTSTSTVDQGGMIQGLWASPHCHMLSSPNLTLEKKGNPNVNPFKHISNHAIPFLQSLCSTPQQAACENSILLIPIGQDGTVPAGSS